MNLKKIFLYWIFLIVFLTFFQYAFFNIHKIQYLNLIDEILIIILFSFQIFLSLIGKIHLKKTVFDIPFAILISFALLTSLVNKVPSDIFLLGMKGYFIYFLFFYSVIWSGFDEKDIRQLPVFVQVVFAIQFFIALGQLIYFSVNGTLNPDSITGTLNGSNFLGYSVFLVLCYSLYEYYFNSNKWNLLFTLFFIALLLMSSARFAILIFPLIFFVLAFKPLLDKFELKKLYPLLFLLGITLTIIILLNPLFIGGGKNIFSFLKPSTLLDYFLNSEFEVESGSARNLWYPLTKENLDTYSKSPLIGFGVGMYASFAAYYFMPDTNLRIYNYFNQTQQGFDANIDSQIIPIWGETGYIGIALFYSLLIFMFFRIMNIHRISKNKDLKAISFSAMAYILFFMVGFYINHMLESQTTGLLFFLFIALSELFYQTIKTSSDIKIRDSST